MTEINTDGMSAEVKLVADLLLSPNRIDRVMRRTDEGKLYSTDAELYLTNDGISDGGPSIRVPSWSGYSPSEYELECEAEAFIGQLDELIDQAEVSE